ncbi:hypothetical protein DL762_001526 [Monosporascus cannonballus]|uniref:DHHA2 domain-containing protein n=1 Tax=Monosporascus cannonballus TaxID=155416 RepID=A0ABY0HGH2_9PEZI|nr:hypothetical protein DL762_001526 [Monosporascus cannonballus]
MGIRKRSSTQRPPDLDSLCSALLLAYLRSNAPPHALHIPLCNLPRDDLALRPEFGAALGASSLTPGDVLTLSELPAPDALRPEDTRWLLVDHNALTGPLGRAYGGRVTGCVDHHEDEGAVPRDADPRVIEKSGSCASLIVGLCRDAWDALDEDAQTDAHLARLALAPILIDTKILGDPHKTTAHDERAVAYAEAKLRGAPDGEKYDRAAFFGRLSELKRDLSALSLRDILRKDYKEWTEGPAPASPAPPKPRLKLGTSSVPRPLSFLVRKAGGGAEELAEALGAWAAERGLDVVAVLTASEADGVFGRELLVWGRGGPRAVDCACRFAEAHAGTLGLRTWGDGARDAMPRGDDAAQQQQQQEWRACWTQGSLQSSRKQVAPLLREAMRAALSA